MQGRENSGAKTAVLFAGGGTGGHIYPNVGIAQQLAARSGVTAHFLVSDRPGDAKILEALPYDHTASPALPLPSARKPWKALNFLAAFRRASKQVRALLETHNIRAVVATGGFVSGPAIVTAARHGVPRILCNLDAVPGQANRKLGRLCTQVFSAYESPLLPTAELVGLPLRDVSRSSVDPSEARRALGLDPDANTVFVTGATHGAESVILAMVELVSAPSRASKFEGWQVFHQCGTYDVTKLQAAYDRADVRAKVVAYCSEMGTAWRASDIAISRSGAGSVAEAWANAVPTIFLPNPYHKDQHQVHNAQPMADISGARLVTDEIDAAATVETLAPTLFEMMSSHELRDQMAAALKDSCPPDGAQRVAEAIDGLLRA